MAARQMHNVSGPASSTSDVDGGLTMLLGDRQQVDARIGRGAGSPVASDRFVGFGRGLRFQEDVSNESLFATRI